MNVAAAKFLLDSRQIRLQSNGVRGPLGRMLAENWAFADSSSFPHQQNFTYGMDLIGPDVAKIRTLASLCLRSKKWLKETQLFFD
jgi:hypothetical protein